MLKTFVKSLPPLSKEISLKQLRAWVTASRRKYQENIFIRTWINIVIFHTFFVAVMVGVFAFVLYYTKLNIFTTFNSMLQGILLGGPVDAAQISATSQALDRQNFIVLLSMVLFSIVTAIIAAHITLVPTRLEFAQRKRFIVGIAHELRTPLAVLRTANEVAMFDVSPDSPFRQVLTDNIEEIKHISNILNNLVVFSRVGTEETLVFEPTDAGALLSGCIAKLTPFASKRNVSLVPSIPPLPEIRANRAALEQVFYNLIKNAIIYAKQGGGTVTIAACISGDHVQVVVADDGIGIAKKDLQHIFEPFFRVSHDNSRTDTGSGLGLSLVFEIMKLHKGRITVESTEVVGTTVTLSFPIGASAERTALPEANNAITFSFES
jgi:signal transduction histidine kinase